MIIKEVLSGHSNGIISLNVGYSGNYRVIIKNPNSDIPVNVYDSNDDVVYTNTAPSGESYSQFDIDLSDNYVLSIGGILKSFDYDILLKIGV